MSIPAVCEQCGNPFEAKYRAAKYCTHACFIETRKAYYASAAKKTRECRQCGREYVRPNSKSVFCGHECYSTSRRATNVPKCSEESCDNPAKQADHGLCTTHRKYRRYLSTERACRQCSAGFFPRRESPATTFCSASCRSEYRCGGSHQPRLQAALAERRYDMALEIVKSRTVLNDKGCHVWQGAKTKNGYGQMRMNGKQAYVHRLVAQASNRMPLGLHPVHHKCANPSCVNPDHLQVTTHRENTAEMLSRKALLAEIEELRQVISDELGPDHPVLNQVSGAA